MKKIIVTGITGQDGSYMVEYLLKNTDYTVYGMIRNNVTINNSYISHILDNPRFIIIHGDLLNSKSIDDLVMTIIPDYFINFAAQTSINLSWQIPEQTVNINTIGVIKCLEAIKKYASHCKFFNAGSSEQFGNINYTPQNEQHVFEPINLYGISKVTAHKIIKIYREKYNMYAVQGILYNHESERRSDEYVTRKITKYVAYIKQAINENIHIKPLELGNLNASRDWSHALDFINGIWKILNQNIPKDYILASGEVHTVREFVELCFNRINIYGHWINSNTNSEIYNTFINNKSVTLIKINTQFYRPLENDILSGDISLAKQELNWHPTITFTDLVNRMVDNDIKLLK